MLSFLAKPFTYLFSGASDEVKDTNKIETIVQTNNYKSNNSNNKKKRKRSKNKNGNKQDKTIKEEFVLVPELIEKKATQVTKTQAEQALINKETVLPKSIIISKKLNDKKNSTKKDLISFPELDTPPPPPPPLPLPQRVRSPIITMSKKKYNLRSRKNKNKKYH